MNIVLAESTDITEINKLIESAKRHWGYSDELINLWLPDLLITPENIISRTFWCMKINEEIKGALSLSVISNGVFELEDFWLAPSLIGTGLGRKMFQYVISHLKSIKAKKMIIISDPNAEGFYQEMGAKRIKFIDSKPKGRVLPVMELSIL